MARTSNIVRCQKRQKCVSRFLTKRLSIKNKTTDLSITPEDRFKNSQELQKLPRNSSKTRLRNRCRLTGRPRGVYRKFGISRNMLRILVMSGEIPGVKKASW